METDKPALLLNETALVLCPGVVEYETTPLDFSKGFSMLKGGFGGY
ncbi:MAG: hypothetical protein FWC28_05755 [Proteobacteria bacterium]|nr:hypothetical protein [Cystobacterineae bacterium]MCL2258908.1 hypothetical protein [Cystobacterineae bacterium]MCL2314736.1 hypothetical protein [Pseudomonadota bacterium]